MIIAGSLDQPIPNEYWAISSAMTNLNLKWQMENAFTRH
jgi:hypothetical protein